MHARAGRSKKFSTRVGVTRASRTFTWTKEDYQERKWHAAHSGQTVIDLQSRGGRRDIRGVEERNKRASTKISTLMLTQDLLVVTEAAFLIAFVPRRGCQ